MGTADQDHDTPDADEATTTEDHDGRVADEGGDSDPAAAADSDATGEDRARQNREDESPS